MSCLKILTRGQQYLLHTVPRFIRCLYYSPHPTIQMFGYLPTSKCRLKNWIIYFISLVFLVTASKVKSIVLIHTCFTLTSSHFSSFSKLGLGYNFLIFQFHFIFLIFNDAEIWTPIHFIWSLVSMSNNILFWL